MAIRTTLATTLVRRRGAAQVGFGGWLGGLGWKWGWLVEIAPSQSPFKDIQNKHSVVAIKTGKMVKARYDAADLKSIKCDQKDGQSKRQKSVIQTQKRQTNRSI